MTETRRDFVISLAVRRVIDSASVTGSGSEIELRNHPTPEQQVQALKLEEQKLKARRKAAEPKLRQYREREAAKNLSNLVQILKRYGINKLTPERLQKALAQIQ